MRKALFIAGVALLAVYLGFMRERINVSVATSDGLDAAVLLSVIAVYRQGGVERAEPPRTLVVSSGHSGTLKLAARWPWRFARMQILAGHPRYRFLQQYEVRNPHWRSRRIEVELASWATRPGGRLVADFDNREQEAEEHLSWLREVYLPAVDPLTATRELVSNRSLLQAIAFAGRRNGTEGDGTSERIGSSLAALETIVSQRRSEPCPVDYSPQPGKPILCGQAQIEIVWPRQ